MRTWKDVATLVKPKNLNGRFVARPAADLPFILEAGMEVALVPPQTDLPRTGTVNYTRDLGDGSYEVGLDTVEDESTAHGLAGCHCLVKAELVSGLTEDGLPVSWEGWRVQHVDGQEIGNVAGILENPGQSLLEVERPGNLPAAYIPVVDAFIVSVDESSRIVVVDVPEGLVTLNDGTGERP